MNLSRPPMPVVIAALSMIAFASEAVAGADCRTVPYVAATCFGGHCRPLPPAACFWVTGRLAFANGTPAVRLWPRGTRRLLGVLGGDGDPASSNLLPPNVERLSRPPTAGDRSDLWGSFQVCPLATEKRGWMRPVCLAEARGLTVSSAMRQ
jgi:hypothetical protein